MPALNGRLARSNGPMPFPDFAGPEPGATAGPAARDPVVVSVCVSCRNPSGPESERPGEAFLTAMRAAAHEAGSPITIRPVQCLSVCKRPCTVALSSPGRYTYMFGDLDPSTGVAALLEGAAIYAGQEHGYMLWRERPEALRKGILARIPPVDWDAEDGRHPR